jgi:CheY-like chemotaxis protein
MNSKLILVSEKGKGSKFCFDLKFEYAGDKKQLLGTSKKTDDDLSGIRILLAEDNQVNMMVAKKILSGFKANPTCVYNGKEALEALQKDASFDIILLDLEMPVMNGYTAIYEIKKLHPHIPAIAFTASLVDQKMLADLVESGFSDCITKPFQPHQLLAGIKKYLSKPHVEVGGTL